MSEGKFIIIDETDDMCIGGFGNDKGNKGLLKYSEEEIAKKIIENNNINDNVRLANSLLRTIRSQNNIINKAIKYVEEHRNIIERDGFSLHLLVDDFDDQEIMDILEGVNDND